MKNYLINHNYMLFSKLEKYGHDDRCGLKNGFLFCDCGISNMVNKYLKAFNEYIENYEKLQ